MKTNIDVITSGGAYGEVASLLASTGRFDPGSMRPWIGDDGRAYITVYKGGDPKKPESYKAVQVNAATLRRDEWKQLDDAVLKVSEVRLSGVQDLIDNGLVYNLGNAMGTTVLEWHDISNAMEAELTMDGVSRGRGDRPTYQTNYLPIPIIHVDYEINARVLEASRKLGNPLDTTAAERAARKVAEKLESMLFTDTTYSWGTKDDRSRNTIYSYLNHPDINTVTLTAQWDASGKTGEQILADVLKMKQASIDAKHYGPWMLYVPTGYETVLDEDYDSTTPGTTIRERILKIGGIKGVKVIDMLPAHHVLLVQITSDVVRLVRGMPIQNVEWQTEGKFVTKYKVMTIQVPQIRSDQEGNSGIVLLAA
ncbi:MAG: encapsulin [Armatimonadetes bacterium]|nr:encapsulin [Armatimonadota bacterium]